MATIKEVLELVFGAKGQKPKTLEQFEAAIAKAEAEIVAADAQASEHSSRAEFLASEIAFDESTEFSARLEKEQAAAKAAQERAATIRAMLTGLRRRHAEILAQQARDDRAAYVESVRAKAKQVDSFAARIDEARANEGLLWSEALTAVAQLQGLMRHAVAAREVAIVAPTLVAMAPSPNRPSARAIAKDVTVVALRAIGVATDEEQAV